METFDEKYYLVAADLCEYKNYLGTLIHAIQHPKMLAVVKKIIKENKYEEHFLIMDKITKALVESCS